MTNEMANRIATAVLLLVFLVVAAAIFASVPHHEDVMAMQTVPNADPSKAVNAMRAYGCGTCHTIPGVPGAQGMVGPRLDRVATRSFLAGQLPNTPDNLILWIQHPQKVRQGSDMPELGVSDADARNIAAYLYSLH